jgi:uncharacterized protein
VNLTVLSISDRVVELIYSPHIRERFNRADLVISCGDLPYYYVEFVVSALNVPVYFVRGNHAKILEVSDSGNRSGPQGANDLHARHYRQGNVLLAGVEGSIRYKRGPFQYTQSQMWWNVFRLVPGLLANNARYGRYLDFFVTHAPPWGIHDKPDWPHQGVRSFLWLIKVFKPQFHFHGHIHLYGPNPLFETQYARTRIINTYGYRYNNYELDE